MERSRSFYAETEPDAAAGLTPKRLAANAFIRAGVRSTIRLKHTHRRVDLVKKR